MKKKTIYTLIMSATISLLMCGCDGSSTTTTEETTTTTTTATTTATTAITTTTAPSAESILNSDEKNMFNMLKTLSRNLLTPSSLRLSAWITGTVGSSTTFHQIDYESGDSIVYVSIIAENRMGGNTESFAYVKDGSLHIIDSKYEALISDLGLPSIYLTEAYAYPGESIDRINIALKEYFDSTGY